MRHRGSFSASWRLGTPNICSLPSATASSLVKCVLCEQPPGNCCVGHTWPSVRDGRARTCVVFQEKGLLLGKVTGDLTCILGLAHYMPLSALHLGQVLPLDQGLCGLGKGSHASVLLTLYSTAPASVYYHTGFTTPPGITPAR